MDTTRNTNRIISQIGFSMLAFVLAKRFAGLILKSVPVLSAHDNPWILYLSHMIPIYLIGFPVFLLCLRFIPNGTDLRPKECIKLNRIFMIYFAGSGLDTIINGAVSVVILALSRFTPVVFTSTTVDLPSYGVNAAIPGLFLGACVAGFGEELIFRKLLYKKMAGCPDIVYILVSGITFGIMHDYLAQGIGHCFAGMMFAYILLRTKSYLTVALLHTLTDSMSLFVSPILQELIGEAGNMVGLLLPVIGIFVFIYSIIRYRKEPRKHVHPATEAGWEFAKGNIPLKTVFCNIGMALYALCCAAGMVYHLF